MSSFLTDRSSLSTTRFQPRWSTSIRPISLRNQFQSTKRKDFLVNVVIMILVTLSVIFYLFVTHIIGFTCRKQTEKEKEKSDTLRKKWMPFLWAIGSIYTIVFLIALITIISVSKDTDDLYGVFGIGIWCQISIFLILLGSEKAQCYHITVMYITFILILYVFMLYSFFFGKNKFYK